jgi:hypothetical protein
MSLQTISPDRAATGLRTFAVVLETKAKQNEPLTPAAMRELANQLRTIATALPSNREVGMREEPEN